MSSLSILHPKKHGTIGITANLANTLGLTHMVGHRDLQSLAVYHWKIASEIARKLDDS